MLFKFAIAIAVVWIGWRMWFGFWRTGPLPGTPTPPPVPPPDPQVREALALLDLPDGASEAEIRAAHRRRMAGAHPDRGGSADEARRLNAARDLLLPRG